MNIKNLQDATSLLKNALACAENCDYKSLNAISDEVTAKIHTLEFTNQSAKHLGLFIEEVLDFWCFDAAHDFYRGDLSEDGWLRYICEIICQIEEGASVEGLIKPWQYKE